MCYLYVSPFRMARDDVDDRQNALLSVDGGAGDSCQCPNWT